MVLPWYSPQISYGASVSRSASPYLTDTVYAGLLAGGTGVTSMINLATVILKNPADKVKVRSMHALSCYTTCPGLWTSHSIYLVVGKICVRLELQTPETESITLGVCHSGGCSMQSL